MPHLTKTMHLQVETHRYQGGVLKDFFFFIGIAFSMTFFIIAVCVR